MVEELKTHLKINSLRITLLLVIGLLVVTSVFFGMQYFLLQSKVQTIQKVEANKQVNTKVVNFAKLFITKVLKAKTEVSFEERLVLENAVRDLNDKEILAQWDKFTASKTETEAQQNVKDLLELLINKIST